LIAVDRTRFFFLALATAVDFFSLPHLSPLESMTGGGSSDESISSSGKGDSFFVGRSLDKSLSCTGGADFGLQRLIKESSLLLFAGDGGGFGIPLARWRRSIVLLGNMISQLDWSMDTGSR
jgi:hypothetical protein